MDRRLSRPFSFLLSIGTPSTGREVRAEIIPGKCADPPAPAIITAYNVSQFENHVRAVCKLEQIPLKKISNAMMTNIIGDQITNYRNKEHNENEFFFDYLKKEIKPKRKMGHLTTLLK